MSSVPDQQLRNDADGNYRRSVGDAKFCVVTITSPIQIISSKLPSDRL
jgi:hypothetical protein